MGVLPLKNFGSLEYANKIPIAVYYLSKDTAGTYDITTLRAPKKSVVLPADSSYGDIGDTRPRKCLAISKLVSQSLQDIRIINDQCRFYHLSMKLYVESLTNMPVDYLLQDPLGVIIF